MSNTRHECKKVDLDIFNDAKYLIVSEEYLPCSPETLFRCFKDADAWPEWVNVINEVEWTSPQPFGVGTTRTVHMPAGMIAYEEFIAWDEPRHMAFRFNQFNRKFLNAFAEDYKVTDLGDNRCHLVWTVAMEQIGVAGLFAPLTKSVVAWQLQGILQELRRYIDKEGQRFCAS